MIDFSAFSDELVKIASVARTTLLTGALGAGLGATRGITGEKKDRKKRALHGALGGAAIGAGSGAVGGLVGRAINRKIIAKTEKEIRRRGTVNMTRQQFFDAWDSAGQSIAKRRQAGQRA